jgi:hypothetical protein
LSLAEDLEERLGDEGQGDEHEVPGFPEGLEESRPRDVHVQNEDNSSPKSGLLLFVSRKKWENGKRKGGRKMQSLQEGQV